MPAFEDPAEWIIKEGSLPENVDPSNSKLESPEERARIAKVFERGLTTPTGYILPVQAWNAKAGGRQKERHDQDAECCTLGGARGRGLDETIPRQRLHDLAGDGEIRFEQTQLYAGGYAQMANAVLG